MSARIVAGIAGIVLIASVVVAAEPAGYRSEKTLVLASGGKIVVETDAGGIRLSGADREGARVVITSRDPEFEVHWTVTTEQLPGEVRVTAKKKDAIRRLFRSTAGPSFEITVPRRSSVVLSTAGGDIGVAEIEGEVGLETSGGGIEFKDIRGAVRAETSGGSLSGSDVVGDIVAETSGGSIRLARVTGNAVAETSGGSISLDGMGGRVEAETSGGSIDASFDRGNAGGGRLETSGGNIRVRLDPSVGLRVEASTTGGSVSTGLPLKIVKTITGASVSGVLGSGGAVLSMETSGGSIRIDGLDSAN